jgi:hypothetical protein
MEAAIGKTAKVKDKSSYGSEYLSQVAGLAIRNNYTITLISSGFDRSWAENKL